MKRQSKQHCRPSRRRGLTLIEVVAAIAILGTLLVGVVLAKSRHTRQLHRARVQAVAVKSADEMIAQWWASSDGVPINGDGVLPGQPTMRWETALVDHRQIKSMGARVVRVQFFVVTSDTDAQLPDDEALVTVDLVVPDPAVEASEAEEAEKQAEAERSRQRAER